MKPQTKYVQLLERELEYLRSQLTLARSDIEFYRGKVERLELSIMSNANAPAQQSYAERSEVKPSRGFMREMPHMPPRIPFSEIKRRWAQLSVDEQAKAIERGWDVTKQEENNAGSQ